VGRYVRWQVTIALVGIVLLSTLLAYSAYSFTTIIIPDRGGTFREGVVGSAQYINPLLCHYNDVDQDLCALVFSGLTRLDAQGRIVPDLAEELPQITPDGLIYTFHLRPDLTWQDGAPITADDVVFTTRLMQDPGFPGIPFLSELWRMVQVEKLDHLTIRFTLAQPFAPFLDYTTIGLLPRHLWGNIPAEQMMHSQLNSSPIGNGLFQVTEVGADHVRLEPNPRYQGATPYLAALEFHFYPDYPSLYDAFKRGEIEGISRVLPQDLGWAEARTDLELFSAPISGYVIVLLNLKNPNLPFLQDKAVRQALLYALDRQQLIDETLAGQGLVAHSLFMPYSWAYNPNIKHYNRDPEQARRLLEQAGYIDSDGDGIREKDGVPLRLILLSDDEPVRRRLAEAISQAWRELGIEAQPQAVSFTGLISDFIYPREFDAAILSWELPGDPDPYPLWHSTQATDGGQNYSGWSNPEADQLIEQARSLVDVETRKALYYRFQELFAEEVPGLLLYYPVYTYGVSTKVHNVEIGPLSKPSDRFRTITRWYMTTRRITLPEARARLPALTPTSPVP
jgi:peptide/nickel transport system substrate-binding protein